MSLISKPFIHSRVEDESPPVSVESFDAEYNFSETIYPFPVPDERVSHLKTLQALQKGLSTLIDKSSIGLS